MNRAIVQPLGYPGVVCASLVMLSTAAGAEYSWQLAGSYRQDDAPRVVESDHSSLEATYYLSPVDDEAGPYELAPFLNRSSYVTVDVARSKLRQELVRAIVGADPSTDGMLPPDVLELFGDNGFPGPADIPPEFGIDTSEYAVSGRYVWPGSGWYAGARAERGDIDQLPQVLSTDIAAEQEGSRLFAGKYFGSRTAVELGFRSMTQRQTTRSQTTFFTGFPFGPVEIETQIDSEDETDDVSLSVRHVGEAGAMTWSACRRRGSSFAMPRRKSNYCKQTSSADSVQARPTRIRYACGYLAGSERTGISTQSLQRPTRRRTRRGQRPLCYTQRPNSTQKNPGMQLHIEPQDDTLVVAVEGRIDGTNAMEFQSTVHTNLGDNKGPLVIDCKNLSYISSAGLRVFLSIARTLQRREGRFAICSLSGMIAQIFQISGFDQIIAVHATREDALRDIAS